MVFLCDHLLGVFSVEFGVDVLRLVRCWKRFDMVLRGFDSSNSEVSADACSFPGDLSEPEAGEDDAVLSEANLSESEVALRLCAWQGPPLPLKPLHRRTFPSLITGLVSQGWIGLPAS